MELLDVYDDNGNLTGKKIVRWKDKLGEHEHVKAVHIIIRNKEGLFLVQKRSATKRTRPSTWDITCGAVSAGEDSVTAACREMSEETGLNATKSMMKYIGTTMSETGVFQDKYYVVLDFKLSDCTMQESEVSEIKLIPKKEMVEFVKGLTHRTEEYREQLAQFIQKLD